MLFRQDLYAGIAAGDITVAFRYWKRPSVTAGGTLQSPVGLLAIDAVDRIEIDDIVLDDALAAGQTTVDGVLASLRPGAGRELYRVRFRYAGDDPRRALRLDDDLDPSATAEIGAQLGRWDAASSTGNWTIALLRLIEQNPAVRSLDLAATVAADQAQLKRRVRQLKSIGLTESLETGYRLSPRGRAFLDAHGRGID